MKLINNLKQGLAAFALSSLALVACEPDENLDYSPLTKANTTVTNSVASYDAAFQEGDTTFLFNLTASEEQIVNIPVDILATENIGFTGEEYTFLSSEFEKGSTQASVSIVFEDNEMPSAMQKLTVQVGDSRTAANATFAPTTYTYSVRDYDAMLSWGDCDADLDMYLLLPSGADSQIYGAATGDCPETIDFASVPDGTYSLYVEIYYTAADARAAFEENDGVVPFDGTELTLVFEASNNSGESLHTITTSYTPDVDLVVTDNPYPQADSYAITGVEGVIIGSVTKSGTTITIRDADDAIVGTM